VRTYRELWLWLGAAFWTLTTGLLGIALAYFAKETFFSLYYRLAVPRVVPGLHIGRHLLLRSVTALVAPSNAKARFPKIKAIYEGRENPNAYKCSSWVVVAAEAAA
jgi:hypothetical protein